MNDERSLVSGDQYLSGLFMTLYRAIRAHVLLVASVTLTVMAIAFFAAQWLPPVYSAQANGRLGRVDGVEAMTPQAAIARMQSPAFKRRVLQSMNLPTDGDQSAQLIFGSLTARPEASETLTISVRGLTEQQARQALDVSVRLLREEQASALEPFLADLKTQLLTGRGP